MSSCPSLPIKPRTDFSLPFSPGRGNFIEKSLSVNKHMLTLFRIVWQFCAAHQHGGEMCVYLMPADTNLQRTDSETHSYFSKLSSLRVLSSLYSNSASSHYFSCISRDFCNRNAQSTNYFTPDIITVIPNNAAFEMSRCISQPCQDIWTRTFSVKKRGWVQINCQTAHSVYTQQSLAVYGKSKQ